MLENAKLYYVSREKLLLKYPLRGGGGVPADFSTEGRVPRPSPLSAPVSPQLYRPEHTAGCRGHDRHISMGGDLEGWREGWGAPRPPTLRPLNIYRDCRSRGVLRSRDWCRRGPLDHVTDGRGLFLVAVESWIRRGCGQKLHNQTVWS